LQKLSLELFKFLDQSEMNQNKMSAQWIFSSSQSKTWWTASLRQTSGPDIPRHPGAERATAARFLRFLGCVDGNLCHPSKLVQVAPGVFRRVFYLRESRKSFAKLMFKLCRFARAAGKMAARFTSCFFPRSPLRFEICSFWERRKLKISICRKGKVSIRHLSPV
jgi:hypothetical protein